MRNAMAIVVGALLGAGCASVGPDYERPALELPAAWPAAPEVGVPVTGAHWWSVYGEPALDRLMAEALEHNKDLALAMARVDEARALVGLARADQFPAVGASASRSRSRMSERGTMPVPAGVDPLSNTNRVTLEASYELDLWGRYRHASEAARAELLASEAARDAVRLSLSAQVAQGYFALASLDAQVAITRRTIEARSEALELQRRRHASGVISEFDLRQVEAELAAARALLPALERQRTQQHNALAVLLGRSPRAIVDGAIERVALFPEAGGTLVVPDGLPSELLLRRPDLREAEQRLVAANARIGVARAAYFPSIALTGYLGSESTSLADLFSGPAGIWQFAVSLTQPIFNAGRLDAQVQASEARQQQALVQYERAVQSAFRDVMDAMAAQSRAREQLEAETERAASLEQALKLARLRYDNGIASLLDVFDAERNLLAAELNRADAVRARQAAIADLAKALGGGWERGGSL
jgi:multidrug efflux system outer membrane protein